MRASAMLLVNFPLLRAHSREATTSTKACDGLTMAQYQRLISLARARTSTSMQGKLLKCNLDPEVVDALKDLKKLLPDD